MFDSRQSYHQFDNAYFETLGQKMSWKRPENIAHPQVWLRFQAPDPDFGGKLVEYRVQDLPVDRFEDAINFMAGYYLESSPMISSTDISLDKAAVQEFKDGSWGVVNQKMTLVCFKENSDEIVGLNFLIVFNKEESHDPPKVGYSLWIRAFD